DRDEQWAREEQGRIGEERFRREYGCEFLIYDETLINSIRLSELVGRDPIFRMGQTRWYRKIDPEMLYLVALDPSLGTGGNYSAIVVFELPSFKQVAEWYHNITPIQGQIKVLKDILDYISSQMEGNINNIYWSIENNTVGEAGLVVIRDQGEEKFPGLMVSEPIRKGHVRKFRKGFNTTHSAKIAACARLKALIETGQMEIYSRPMISELKAFIAHGFTFKAKEGDHDDLVSALLLLCRMSNLVADWDPRVFESLNIRFTRFLINNTMSANFERIAIDLGRQLQTRFPSLRRSTADDKPIDGVNLKDKDARKFNFNFIDENGRKLVNVTISLNQEDDDGGAGLDVQWTDKINNSSWDKFIRTILPKFAQTHGLNFNAQNPSQSNLVKRDPLEEHNMNESKLFGTSKTSYQEMGEAKIIVRHTQPINFNAPNGRTQHIENIYVENQIGERFRYPIKHLNGARAMARHIAEGGSFFDDIGNYIIGLSEELGKLRIFKTYVDRSPVVSENMGNIQNKVIDRITNIKEEIHALQIQKHYVQFKENFSVGTQNDVPEDILNDWIDRLTVRSFNEELKDAFPYIYRLVDETQIPIKELSADDILEGDKEPWDPKNPNHPPFEPDPPKKGKEAGDKAKHGGHSRAKHLAQQGLKNVKEFSMFEKYLNQIVSENDDLFNSDEEVQNQALEQLKQLFNNELPLGTNGANAADSISGIIDERKLTKAFELLADLGLDEMDARPIINEFLRSYDAENGTDLSDRLGFDGADPVPTVPPPAAAPAAPPPEAVAPPPEAVAPPPEAVAP
ncbi:MAG: hypothetical protein EBT86_11750, partial [Actinobacteria bacterium]|nr:hypothetical protein [Actinomycetota bacterium]